tara:strand:+ start:84 stop:386 length:303 start_codon:yes stop_codon:yes gene_type:complete
VKDSIERLQAEIDNLNVSLKSEEEKNKLQEENFYNLTKQLHQIQESFSELSEELELLKLNKKAIMREMDILLKDKLKIERLCQEQSNEIERGIILIENYL